MIVVYSEPNKPNKLKSPTSTTAPNSNAFPEMPDEAGKSQYLHSQHFSSNRCE